MGQLIVKELTIGLVTSSAVSLLAFFRVLVEFPKEPLSAVALGMAMFAAVIISIVLGVVFSWGLEKIKIDPAAGSAPLLTTVSDLIGIALLVLCSTLVLGTL